jgi:hypothetical protein
MRSVRNEIKHIMRALTILATLFAMTFVLAGSASAVVIGPLGNAAVVHAPIGTAVSTLGVRPAFNPVFKPNPIFRPNPFAFRPNPFAFRPNAFAFRPNAFAFRPAFFNPFFGADLDDFGFGFGFGFGEGIGEAD